MQLRHSGWHNAFLLSVLLFTLLARPLMAQNQCPVGLITVVDEVVTYDPLPTSSPDLDVEYDAGAISGWYSLASGFVNVVRPGSLPYDTIRLVLTAAGVNCPPNTTCTSTLSIDDPVGLLREFSDDLALFWAGIIAVTIIGALLSCGFCISGCCFWCCRCCGNCGGSKRQKVSDNMDCKTFTFTIILVLVTVFLSAGVVLAFFSNEQTFHSVASVQSSITTVAQHGVDYVTDTVDEVVTLACQLAAEDGLATEVVAEAQRFSDELEIEIQDLGVQVNGILNTLNGLSGQLNSTQMILSAVGSTTVVLLGNVTMLQSDLDSIRMSVESLNTQCDAAGGAFAAICSQIPDPSIYNTGANYTMLPNVTQSLNDVQSALDGVDLDNLIATGRDEFNTTSSRISTEVSGILQDSTSMLEQVNGSFFGVLNNLTGQIDQYTAKREGNCPGLIDSFNFNEQSLSVGYIQECVVDEIFNTAQSYDRYRYGFGITICSLGIVVIVLVVLGVVMGMAGFRKDREPSDRTRLSHCGGICLLVGVAVTFLIGSLLLILATIFFFFGASFQKACLSISGPDYPLFAEIVDNQEYWNRSLIGNLVFNSPDPNAVLSISQALRNCEEDMSLYQALNLSYILPSRNVSAQIEALVDFSDLRSMVDGFIANATNEFNYDSTSFLPQEAQDSLNQFVDANVSAINITEYRVQLEAPLLQFNLTENVQTFTDIRNELDTLAQAGSTEAGELRDDVDAIIISLMSIDDSIPTIQTQVNILETQVNMLSSNVKTVVMDTTGVVNNVTSLLNDITSDSGALRQFLDVTARGAIDNTIGYLEGYIAHLDTAIANDVGRCRPIYAIYTDFYNSVCREFLDGLNGFWWSLGFCSLLFIPVIIFSVITSTYYLRKKTDDQNDSYSDYPMKSY